MIKRFQKRWPFGLIVIVGSLFMLWLSLNAPVAGCKAYAAELQPSDYCYRFTVSVQNTSGTDKTNTLVPFTINAASFISSEYLGRYAWDIKTTPISLNPEIAMFAQDLTSGSATWWLYAYGTIPNGSTAQYIVNTGNAEAKRDQGIQFNALDVVTVADNASYDLTNDITIIVRACAGSCASPSATGQNAKLFDKYNSGASQGYALQTVDTAGALYVRGIANGQILDVAWDGTQKDIKMTFVAPTLTIYFDGVSQGSLNTGLGGVTTNATDISIGSTFTGDISYATIWTSNTPISVWGIEPTNITQVSAVAPTYTGTITDELSAHNATYTFTRSTTGLTVTLGPTTPINSEPLISVLPVFGNQLGAQNLSGIYSANESTYTGPIPGLSYVSEGIASTGAPQEGGWIVFWAVLGLLAILPVIFFFPNLVLIAAVFGAMLAFGASAETISWFWLIGYIIGTFVAWAAWQFQKQG